MKITMDGKYTTRDGRVVRILCVDGPGCYPVAGYVIGDCSSEVRAWRSDGIHAGNPHWSLIEAKPEPIVEWLREKNGNRFWYANENYARECCKVYGGRLAKRTTEFVD